MLITEFLIKSIAPPLAAVLLLNSATQVWSNDSADLFLTMTAPPLILATFL